VRPYTHPKDLGLKFQRKIGKRRRKAAANLAAVAKLAPHELDSLPETPIRQQVHADIEATGLPYLTLDDDDLYWLKREADKGNHHAMGLLSALKDLPDFIVWRPAPGMPYALSLPLELKKQGKGGRPGQRAFRDGAGGFITQGYTPAQAALRAFLEAPAPKPEAPAASGSERE
jgi:hypothetical protein